MQPSYRCPIVRAWDDWEQVQPALLWMNHLFHLVSQHLHHSRHSGRWWCGIQQCTSFGLTTLVHFHSTFSYIAILNLPNLPLPDAWLYNQVIAKLVLTSEKQWKIKLNLSYKEYYMFYSLIHSEQWKIFFFSSDTDLKKFLFSHWLSKWYYWSDLTAKSPFRKLLKYN